CEVKQGIRAADNRRGQALNPRRSRRRCAGGSSMGPRQQPVAWRPDAEAVAAVVPSGRRRARRRVTTQRSSASRTPDDEGSARRFYFTLFPFSHQQALREIEPFLRLAQLPPQLANLGVQ